MSITGDIEIYDLNDTNIKVTESVITFPEYERLLSQAHQVAEMVRSTEVTEDNIKETKKLLANVNKAVGRLEGKRKEVKRYVLEPYTAFEAQVKEIVSVVKEADQGVRSMVRELEEREREAKKAELLEEWQGRQEHYTVTEVVTFGQWLTPQHLNKTASLNKTIEDMAQWLEAKQRDWETAQGLNKDVAVKWVDSLDLSTAIQTVKDEEAIKATITKDSEASPVTVFIIRDAKDAKFAEMLLKENDIQYVKEIK